MKQSRDWIYMGSDKRRVDPYVDEDDRVVRGELQVKCCGEWLSCLHFTNTCPYCYSDYNMSGGLLAPRDQWGDETGESVSDILSVDYRSTEKLLDGEA